jgi:hypothetical protein
MWDDNNYMRFFHPCSIPFIDKSTLCSPKMKFAIVNVVIANPTQTYLLPRSCATHGFVALNAAQAKEKNYHD